MGNFGLGLLFGALALGFYFTFRNARNVTAKYRAAKASFEAVKVLDTATNTAIAVMEYLCNIEHYMRMHGEADAIARIRSYQTKLAELIVALDACSEMEGYPRVIKQVQQAKTFVDRYLNQYKG